MDDPLVARLVEDLDGTFEALVREHQDRLYSLALRSLGDPRDAEEVTQDSFVRAYRALRGYDTERRRTLQLRPWLSTIVLNLCRNHAKRARPITVTLDGDAPEPTVAQREPESPERLALRREEQEAWAGRVRALPARYREPILLRFVDDLAYAEMSAALDLPEGTLRAQVHRGLALLRSALERESSATTPASDSTSLASRALRLQEVAP
jgi:RNA polymerase sigma-70 factor (ECF subfamily)